MQQNAFFCPFFEAMCGLLVVVWDWGFGGTEVDNNSCSVVGREKHRLPKYAPLLPFFHTKLCREETHSEEGAEHWNKCSISFDKSSFTFVGLVLWD